MPYLAPSSKECPSLDGFVITKKMGVITKRDLPLAFVITNHRLSPRLPCIVPHPTPLLHPAGPGFPQQANRDLRCRLSA